MPVDLLAFGRIHDFDQYTSACEWANARREGSFGVMLRALKGRPEMAGFKQAQR